MLHRNSERWKKNGEYSDDHDDTKKSGLSVQLSDGTVPPFSDQDSVRSQSRSFRHHHSGQYFGSLDFRIKMTISVTYLVIEVA